jgi:hypothetical protein
MTDGWTSGKGLGLGLPGTKRLVHEFSIDSVVGEGTRVTIVRWNTIGGPDEAPAIEACTTAAQPSRSRGTRLRRRGPRACLDQRHRQARRSTYIHPTLVRGSCGQRRTVMELGVRSSPGICRASEIHQPVCAST